MAAFTTVQDIAGRSYEDEEWRAIPGCEGLYEVSSQGRVRRLTRRAGFFQETLAEPAIITPKRWGKYLAVTLWRDGWSKRFYIHQLVLRAFVGPPPGNDEGSHEDGDRTHNALSNLMWESRKKNLARRRGHGTMLEGEAHPNAKLSNAEVAMVLASKDSHVALAARFGVSRSLISQIKRREARRHAC